MGIPNMRGLLALSFLALLLAGCASNEPEDTGMEVAPEDGPPTTTEAPPMPKKAPAPMVNSNGNLVISTLNSMGSVSEEELQGVFYFDFDQAIVKRSGHAELNKHARALAGDRALSIRLEGHADERGTREYNLALGERRANAIRAYLVAQGVSSSRIEVISYGEEKPANGGHNESSWSKNRRVEVVYR
jgi:peptidoglycan-associated lipoprotein